jgi:hypothetical protein
MNLSSPTVNSVAFSPDGKYILTGSLDRTARLWDAATGQVLRTYVGHTNSVTSVAFSSDGKRILTGSADFTARLWDVDKDQSVRTFTGHTSSVNSVAFSPNGRYALTGSADIAARLWDVETGQSSRTFRGHINSVNKVAFSPDGRYVLTSSVDTTTRLWMVNYPDVIDYVCSWLPRDFTADERARYGIGDPAATCPQFANEGTPTLALPPTTTLLATWTPSTATALPLLSPTVSPTVGPSPTRDRTRISTPTDTRTPTNTRTPTATLVVDLSRTVIASPTIAPTNTLPPTPTADFSAYEIGDVESKKTADELLRLKQPPKWRIAPQSAPGTYVLTAGPVDNPGALLSIVVAAPETITRNTIGLTATYTSPQAALDSFLLLLSPLSFRVSPVTATKIGAVEGYGVRYTGLSLSNPYEYDVRLAALPDGRWIYVLARARADLWIRAQPALETVIASIEVLPVPMPTATPTVVMQSTP